MNSEDYLTINFKNQKYKFPRIIEGRFILGRQIDNGSFGTIYDCTDNRNNKKYVVKIVK